MSAFLACSECGQLIPVDDELIRNALTINGEMPSVKHEPACPGAEVDAATGRVVERRFGIHLAMYEIPEGADADAYAGGVTLLLNPTLDNRDPDPTLDLLAEMGQIVVNPTFAGAVNGAFTEWLNKTWPKLQETAVIADHP